MDVGTSP